MRTERTLKELGSAAVFAKTVILLVQTILRIQGYRLDQAILLNYHLQNTITTNMDPFIHKIEQYSQLPIISPAQLAALKKEKKVLLLGNLVVDIEDFDHPGYNALLNNYLNTDAYITYIDRNHSINADLIACQRTIGKVHNQQLQHQTMQFYHSTANNEKVQRHNQILKKLQPNQPLLQSIKSLKADQLFLMTQIPKLFKNPEKVTFLSGKFQNFMYQEHFWISTPIFISYLLALTIWVFNRYEINQILLHSIVVPIGIFVWTVIEYTYHRFLFHPTLQQFLAKGSIRGHSLHHAFPNLNKKLSLDIRRNSITILMVYLIISVVLSQLIASMFLVGLLSFMIFYDAVHYYCHFGPQIEISWLKTLRINHLKHHYRNQNTNFGVTTNFWDKIMGTYDPKTKDK